MVRRRWRAVLGVVTVFSTLAIAGCSSGELSRQPVSGYVNLDGVPLAKGLIIFYPAKGIDLDFEINGGAMVKDGYFSISRTTGLIPGDYHVAIRAAETRPRRRHERQGEPGDDATVAEEVIPAKYNSETDLRVEIKDNAIKEVTFHLDSQ